jgi:excisionase family DNA binding protein
MMYLDKLGQCYERTAPNKSSRTHKHAFLGEDRCAFCARAKLEVTEMQLFEMAGLAVHLRKSVRTLQRMIRDGEAPPSFFVGRNRLWREADVDAWLVSLATTGRPARRRNGTEPYNRTT